MSHLLTVITVVKNDIRGIEKTIKSVLAQKKKIPFEYLVVDGASNDGTFEKIKKYRDQIDSIISKKDKGLYFALNNAIKIAKGYYIGILHSGDIYNNSNVIKRHEKLFIKKKFDLIYSNLNIVENKKIYRFYNSSYFKKEHLLIGWMPPHPTCFIKKKKIIESKFYDTNYKISADFDLLLKIIYIKKASFIYLPIISILQSRRGLSDSGLSSKILIIKEIIQSLKKNKLYISFFFIFLRYFIKLKELIFKK